MSTHTCHAIGCTVPCPPTHLTCTAHWRMVPFAVQQLVYCYYRKGQCDDKQPSAGWMIAAFAAVLFVAAKERPPRKVLVEGMRSWVMIMEPIYYKDPDTGEDYRDSKGKRYSERHFKSGRPRTRWLNQTLSGQNRLGPSPDRWRERSRTYQGIADAMAEQWGGLDA